MKEVITSPIRWSGSKRKIITHILPLIDNKKKNYIEPFLGSATMLLNVLKKTQFESYYVNDINTDIVNFFETLKEDPYLLLEKITDVCIFYNSLIEIDQKKAYFYEKRDIYNTKNEEPVDQACLFWFLTKTCFNGVYRVNRQGKYNVPFGKKETIKISVDDFLIISELLKKVIFFNDDYSLFLKKMDNLGKLSEGFIYLDPPYIPETTSSKNQKMYTSSHFQHDEHIRLINQIQKNTNSSIMLSMSDSIQSREIYQSLSLKKTKITEIIRVVNPNSLLSSSEIIFTNYKIPIK